MENPTLEWVQDTLRRVLEQANDELTIEGSIEGQLGFDVHAFAILLDAMVTGSAQEELNPMTAMAIKVHPGIQQLMIDVGFGMFQMGYLWHIKRTEEMREQFGDLS